jgi:hypothetical protein
MSQRTQAHCVEHITNMAPVTLGLKNTLLGNGRPGPMKFWGHGSEGIFTLKTRKCKPDRGVEGREFRWPGHTRRGCLCIMASDHGLPTSPPYSSTIERKSNMASGVPPWHVLCGIGPLRLSCYLEYFGLVKPVLLNCHPVSFTRPSSSAWTMTVPPEAGNPHTLQTRILLRLGWSPAIARPAQHWPLASSLTTGH